METKNGRFIVLKFADINNGIFVKKIKIDERPGNSSSEILGVLGGIF
jgi:hypothetical protein